MRVECMVCRLMEQFLPILRSQMGRWQAPFGWLLAAAALDKLRD